MAEMENQLLFAELLYSGVASLKSHPVYRTKRKKRELQLTGQYFSESYLDKISKQLGISSNTLKSWIGQMGMKYVPGRIEDSKLFGLLWIVLKHSDMQVEWFNQLLSTTSIPVLDPPSPVWIKACLKKAKLLIDNETFGNPALEEIDELVVRLFRNDSEPQPLLERDLLLSNESPHSAHPFTHNLTTRWSNVFVGRRRELEILNKWMHSASPACLITGWGGNGKSTLALEAAYACLGEARGEASRIEASWPKFSCIIWISTDLEGMSFNFFLDTIAYQLGRVELLEHSENEKQFVVRNALATYSISGNILLIVDNIDASGREILAFITTLPQRTKVILTSRDHQQQLYHNTSRDLFTIQMDGLDQSDALNFISQQTQYYITTSTSDRKRTNLEQLLQSENQTLSQLIEATTGNPKALLLSIAYIADDVFPIEAFIQEIRTAGYSFTTLFEYLFGHTWERCHEDVRKLWMVLSFFHTPPDEYSWAAVAGLERLRFHQAVDQMRAYALIATERAGDHLCYRAHQTVIFYGEQKLAVNDLFVKEAQARWGQYYIKYVDNHLQHIPIDHLYWKCLPGRDLTPVKREWPNLYKLLNWCEKTQQDELLIALMLRLSHFLSRINLPLRIEYGLKAANAANRHNQLLQEALFRIDTVGWAHFEMGNMEEGLEQMKLALHILEDKSWHDLSPQNAKERDDLLSLGYQFKARYYVATKQFDLAEKLLGAALSIIASPVIQHRALLLKGNIETLYHRYDKAIKILEEANRVSQLYGGEKSIESFYYLGVAYNHCYQFQAAEETFKNIVSLESNPNQIELIYYQFGMAQLHAMKGEIVQAMDLLQLTLSQIDSWEQGIQIRQEIEQFHDQLLTLSTIE